MGELQFFLRTIEGDTSVSITNEYDEATIKAVHAFQTRYAEDILEPWGMIDSSGYVYYTTQKKVNELWCSDLDFSLDAEQLKEIEAFKTRNRSYIERSVEVPTEEFELYGTAEEVPLVPLPDATLPEETGLEEGRVETTAHLNQVATVQAATEGTHVLSSHFNALRTNVIKTLFFSL